MNYYSILSELVTKLQSNYKKFKELDIKNKTEIYETCKKINAILQIIRSEIQKLKSILKKENELKIQKEISDRYDEKLIQINNVLIDAISQLKQDNNIFKLSSSQKSLYLSYLTPRDLINFTLRVNKTYAPPISYSLEGFLPYGYLRAYPHEDEEMKSSILKFNLDDNSRLKRPIVAPSLRSVKKGEILKVSYPDEGIQDVFFKYTLSKDLIPSYFSGELYSESSPIIINKNTDISICSCKIGHKDSLIVSLSYFITDEIENTEIITMKIGREKNNFVQRPEMEIKNSVEGYIPMYISPTEDDNSSHCTPGSMNQSIHKRESNYLDNDYDLI